MMISLTILIAYLYKGSMEEDRNKLPKPELQIKFGFKNLVILETGCNNKYEKT